MLQETNSSHQATLTPLVGGILEDARQLMRQEFALVRSEIKHQLGKAKAAAIYLIVACGLGLASVGLVLIMLVHMLMLAFPALPVWASYGIVALLGVAGAFFLMLFAKNSLRADSRSS